MMVGTIMVILCFNIDVVFMDIILIIYLAWKMGRLAGSKGLSSVRWRWYTVLAWVGGEFVGILIGIMLWGQNNLLMLNLTGIGVAIAAYFTLRDRLLKKDDSLPTDFDFENEHNDINKSKS